MREDGQFFVHTRAHGVHIFSIHDVDQEPGSFLFRGPSHQTVGPSLYLPLEQDNRRFPNLPVHVLSMFTDKQVWYMCPVTLDYTSQACTL